MSYVDISAETSFSVTYKTISRFVVFFPIYFDFIITLWAHIDVISIASLFYKKISLRSHVYGRSFSIHRYHNFMYYLYYYIHYCCFWGGVNWGNRPAWSHVLAGTVCTFHITDVIRLGAPPTSVMLFHISLNSTLYFSIVPGPALEAHPVFDCQIVAGLYFTL